MVKKQLVSSSIVKSVTYSGINGKKYIVIHETANTSKGANAQAHANLQSNGNSRQASWQYTADDKQVVQSFSDNAQCWHAGNKYYNQNGIGIEICVNSDGDYKKAVENAAKLTKKLMDKYNISLNNVIQHNKASGKDCPHFMRAGSKGITWSGFKSLVKGDKGTESKPSKPSKKPSKPSKKPSTNLGLVDWMKANKMDSSYNNRKKLAGQYGVKNYSGTAKQNTTLLTKLKAGKPKPSKPSKPAKKGNQTTNSIVTYLKSVNINSSYSNRKKLAQENGIKNYAGTAAQNTKLLNILRDGGSIKAKTSNIKQLADKIINSTSAPTGNEARRKWLGVSKATYDKVRAEINRRYS